MGTGIEGYCANVDDTEQCGGFAALHLAAFNGHINATKALKDIGADISATDNKGQTALHVAARGGHRDVLELLLS